MAVFIDRSMNLELQMGVLDGTVRMLRPNAANAEESTAAARAAVLHPLHYGTMGVHGGYGAVELGRVLGLPVGLGYGAPVFRG